jgi:ornithine cyclodeaminase
MATQRLERMHTKVACFCQAEKQENLWRSCNASAITEIRTAAVSAVATRALAREDAADLALIGSGIQARAHLVALSAVRKIKRARVFSPNPDHPKQLADEMRSEFSFPIEPISSAEEACCRC